MDTPPAPPTVKFNPFSTFVLGITALSLLIAIFAAALVGVYWHSNDVSQQNGVQVELKLCTTLDKLAALKPPPGNAQANPSRAYLQQEHATLAELGIDLGCQK